MKICQPHWDKLRAAIDARGLSHLVATDGRQAMQNTVLELEGRSAEAYFDPLMACNNMLWGRAMAMFGLAAMRPAGEDGQEPCPACDLIAHLPPPPAGHRYPTNEAYFIDGPADAVLEVAREKGLVPTPLSARDADAGGQTPTQEPTHG